MLEFHFSAASQLLEYCTVGENIANSALAGGVSHAALECSDLIRIIRVE